MHLLGDLGVDISLLVAQIVNFLFLLWVLSKFVYKPLVEKIESDEKALSEIKNAQAQLEKKEKDLKIREKTHSTQTKNRAKSIIKEAEEIAATIIETAQTEARTEKEAVIKQINRRLAEVSHDNS